MSITSSPTDYVTSYGHKRKQLHVNHHRVADNTPEHVQHCLEILNDWDYDLEHNCDFTTYLYGHILDPHKVLTKLNTCNCCRKHQVNRPEKLDIWTNTSFNNTQDPDCLCACRHTARYVCRAFKGEIRLKRYAM